MSLNVDLGETDAQSNSMNLVYVEIIKAMEDTMSSIVSFTLASSLQGKTYRTAKKFMMQTYMPLAQGIIYLSEELIRQNSKYPGEFRTQVSTTNIIEHEVLEQIRELNQMIARLENLNSQTAIFSMSIYLYKTMKRMLEEKLNNLYRYNAHSANHFDMAFDLAKNVMIGLNQMHGGKGFNRTTGTFSTQGMNLGWVSTIDQIHYTRKATEKYGDFLKENPEKLQEIITIVKYEERHPEYVNVTNEFLAPLDEQDIIGIKYLLYTAEEPYRTLTLQYLDRLELIPVTINPEAENGPGPSFFRPSENSITYVYERDRTNARGEYFTIFHEIAHAIDYNYGYDVDGGFIRDIKEFFGTYDYYSDSLEIEGKTLANQMYIDFENTVNEALIVELNTSKFNDLSHEDKNTMVNNITENLLNQDRNFESLSPEERELQMLIEDHFSAELRGPNHSIASDVYGGITNLTIQGSYGHSDDYWFKNGRRIKEPNREGFAEYFARLVTQDENGINPGIESVEQFMPSSKEHLDEMIESMDRK